MDTSRKHLEHSDHLARLIGLGLDYQDKIIRPEFRIRSGFRPEGPLDHVMIGGKSQMGYHPVIKGVRNVPPPEYNFDLDELKPTQK